MSIYKLQINYRTQWSGNKSKIVEVEADTFEGAKKKASRAFRNSWVHRNSKIRNIVAVGGIATIDDIVLREGDEITISQPMTGRLKYGKDETVLIMGDGDARRFTRDALEKLTGFKIAKKPAPITVRYLSLYPNSSVYEQSYGPVRWSSYGLENLIQIKLTEQDGKIINKEFV